jgi:hypothetical protein
MSPHGFPVALLALDVPFHYLKLVEARQLRDSLSAVIEQVELAERDPAKGCPDGK